MDKLESPEIRPDMEKRKDSERVWRDVFKIPDNPPWNYDLRALKLDPRPGLERRPLIRPPPFHHPEYVVNDQEPVLKDPMHSEYRKRLEDRAREEAKKQKLTGQIVYNETAKYSIPLERTTEGTYLPTNSCLSGASNTLVFESRFESGNLAKAIQVGFYEYDLYLRPDQSGHVQWYYFMISNVRRGVTYVFNIVNFVKSKSLYNNGLRPLLYSSTDALKSKIGWQRAKSRCAYYLHGSKYKLTINISFPHDNDRCFLAHCYPYTYTDLQLYLQKLEGDDSKSGFLRRSLLCTTLAQNRVDILTITDKISSYHIDTNSKPTLLLTARVHPGESQASWSMQGCIDFLTSDSPQAVLLRERYVVIIVPMLNPDGVIDGQYRCCSVVGEDLNRRWLAPTVQRYPSIFHIKNLAISLSKRTPGLVFYCDFHGHSTKHKAFMYGCDSTTLETLRGTAVEPRLCNPDSKNAETRFPTLLGRISPAFSLAACDFRVDRCKLTTGRVVMAVELGVKSSYTLEVSFLGGRLGSQLVHFNQEDLQVFGQQFGEALVLHHLGEDAPSLSLVKLQTPSETPESSRSNQVSQGCVRDGCTQGSSILASAGSTFSVKSCTESTATDADDAGADVAPRPHIPRQDLCADQAISEPTMGGNDGSRKSTADEDSLSSASEDDDDESAASSVPVSDVEDQEELNKLASAECSSFDGGERTAPVECDAPSLLLLRFSEPNTGRHKLVRCQTDLSPPLILGNAAHAGQRSPGLGRLRTAAADGALLVCGASVSRSVTRRSGPRVTVEERAQATAQRRAVPGSSSLPLSPTRGTLCAGLGHAPTRRSAPAAMGASVFGMAGFRYNATPPRCVGQRFGNDPSPPRCNAAHKDISTAGFSVAARNARTGLRRSSLGDQIDLEPPCAWKFPEEAVSSEAVCYNQLGSPSQPGIMIPGWEEDCLRYAAEALGEAGMSRDAVRFSGSRQSADIACELPSPLPGLFAVSSLPASSMLGPQSPRADINATNLPRWGLDSIVTTANLNHVRDRSPWRPGIDCQMESTGGRSERPQGNFPATRGEVSGDSLNDLEAQSIAQARSNIRRILMRATSAGVHHGQDTHVSSMTRAHPSPISIHTGYRNRLVAVPRPAQTAQGTDQAHIPSRSNQFAHSSEALKVCVAVQPESDLASLRPRQGQGRETVGSESLEWVGGCGGKVRSRRVWKHPMLATPLLSSQITAQANDRNSNASHGNLPPIASIDLDVKKAAGHYGQSRIPTATLTLY